MLTATAISSNTKKELAKYFQLAATSTVRLGMFSDFLDDAWHEMLEDREEYESFCMKACGRVVEHIDSSMPGASGHGPITWIKEYEQRFGPLSVEWFMDSHGQLDSVLYDEYLRTGLVVAAWKCTPK